MRILFDQGTPVPLRHNLVNHEVETAYERGWSELENGSLLDAAERDGFDLFVTTDSKLKHQQNLASRQISIVVLLSTSWPRIQRRIDGVVEAIESATPGTYRELEIP